MNSLFSQRLKTLREERGLTMQKLGEEIGTSGVSIGYYERGERVPDIHILAKMCQFFSVTSDYLIGLEDCRTHEAADISARTGLTEAAVEVLEYNWDLIRKTISEISLCDLSLSGILSEIIEANMVKMTFIEFLDWYGPRFIIKSPKGDEIDATIDVITKSDGTKRIIYRTYSSEDGDTFVEIDDINTSQDIPDSVRRACIANYDEYSQLCERCREGADVIDNIRELYNFTFFDDSKLLFNKQIGLCRVSGGMSEQMTKFDRVDKEFMDENCSETTPGVISIPLSEYADEIVLRKICDSFRALKKKRKEETKELMKFFNEEVKKHKEATNAGEE